MRARGSTSFAGSRFVAETLAVEIERTGVMLAFPSVDAKEDVDSVMSGSLFEAVSTSERARFEACAGAALTSSAAPYVRGISAHRSTSSGK